MNRLLHRLAGYLVERSLRKKREATREIRQWNQLSDCERREIELMQREVLEKLHWKSPWLDLLNGGEYPGQMGDTTISLIVQEQP